MGEQSGSRIALILVNFLVFAGTVAINQLSAFPQFAGGLFVKLRNFATTYGLGVPPQGIFNSTVGNLSAIYEIDVTPAGFTFLIWTVIYIWLLLAHLYALILLCRRNAVGPVYLSPGVLTPAFLVTYTINLLANVTWLFLWDRQYIIYSSAILWVVCLTNWIAFGFIHGSLHRHGPWMSSHAKVDLWMFRILWHNGIALYTTWTTIAALLNLGIALKYEANLEMQLVVYVVLGSLSGIMLLWFILENTALDRFVRYTITQYAVVVLAMVGIYIKQYNGASLETGWFIVVLLGVAVFCLVARLGLVIVRACKSPLYANNKVGDDPVLSYAA
ncbi:uncharacterized protein LOC125046115 isoform X1 [Penaeus chinensis]|uniref:uncharacterized protein LOC125046115 isoform X1 n=1 Tax=Penaeus chinensis TaxID=139456 RepID=UPI001FB84CF2|nr:uncharacterized protein LOC125046115 isoform X1 [Penaeus chinensis]